MSSRQKSDDRGSRWVRVARIVVMTLGCGAFGGTILGSVLLDLPTWGASVLWVVFALLGAWSAIDAEPSNP